MLLVDGHNLIGRSGRLSLSEEERSRIELLRRIAARKGSGGRRVVVVFDGDRPQKQAPERFGGVTVVFASAGRTADEVILQKVEAAPPRAVTVVTSDRQLAERARARGALVTTAEEFWKQLSKSKLPASPGGDKPTPSPEDAEEWLALFRSAKKPNNHKM